MEVQLYVYDISQGLARQWSGPLIGTQIDAVYHTSLVFHGVEFFFGAGVQTCNPGQTHHGRPMEVIPMGQTQLPMEVILEYLESLKAVYTPESYDLFLHNCNNFTNDFATFLVGKGIPDHITSLPQTVLNTPFGQMLKPQLDQSMRGITQAPVPSSNDPFAGQAQNGLTNGNSINLSKASPQPRHQIGGMVHKPTTLKQLDELLVSAKDKCAVIFFTSATCPPCKLVYPAYDELAANSEGKAVLIKVDLSEAHEIGSRYQVRVTPTFWTFLKGEKENEWKGANESQLRGNVNLLIQMANPVHPHTQLKLDQLQRPHRQFVTYAKVPPMDKMMAKLGMAGQDSAVKALSGFISTRQNAGAIEAPLPDMPAISSFVLKSLQQLPIETLFPLVDLLRLAFVDPRFSGYFAGDLNATLQAVLERTVKLEDKCPYQLRIVTIHLACNAFTSSVLQTRMVSAAAISSLVLQLVTSSLLDASHLAIRVAAASLAFNITAFNHFRRLEDEEDALSESHQVELMASLLEAISRERESLEGLRGMMFAAGFLEYKCPKDGELEQVCEAVGGKDIIRDAKGAFKELKGLGEEVERIMS